MTGPMLQVPEATITHHVKIAIVEIADATEGLSLTVDALEESVGPVPADADAPALRQAAHSLQTAADQIVSLALTIARAAGVFRTMAVVKSASEDAKTSER